MIRLLLVLLAAAGGTAAVRSRRRHQNETDRIWSMLEAPTGEGTFDSSMVEELPTPAQRYLRRVIAPGTPLRTTVRLKMHGSIRLKPGGAKLPMVAEQILAPPRGFVWHARVAKGPIHIRGFDRIVDGRGLLRWWLYGLIPVVRAGGSDVDRSAAGRLAGESILVPAFLLARPGVRWETVDDRKARVTIEASGEPVEITVRIDEDGRLQRVSFMRWRGDIDEPGYVRFDVDEWSDERTFGGYTIPTSFRAGWRLGEDDEYPFFFAQIDEAEYL